MGRRSDYKKGDDLAAFDLDKGCRRIVDQSTKPRRRLKARLRRMARKRVKNDATNTSSDIPLFDGGFPDR